VTLQQPSRCTWAWGTLSAKFPGRRQVAPATTVSGSHILASPDSLETSIGQLSGKEFV